MADLEAIEHPTSRRREAAMLPRPVPAVHFMVIFLGVVLSFTGATSYSQYMERRISADAAAIIDNATPSVEHLGKTQDHVRRIQLVLRHHGLLDADHRTALEEIERARADLHAELDAYLRLPTFPGERAVQHRLLEAMVVVDEVLDRIVGGLARDDVREAVELAHRELAPAVRAVVTVIVDGIEINAAKAKVLAKSIERTRARSSVVAVALHGVSAVLAVIAGYVLFRAVRRHAALYEAHRKLLQLRADELEQFAGRVAHDITNPMSAIALGVSLAERSLAEEHAARARLARVRRSLHGMERIVEGLLEFARAGARPTTGASTDVAVVLDDVLDDARVAAEGVSVELVVEPFAPCAVACSGGILASLLSNLVGNAIKHMGNARQRRVTVRVGLRGEMVRFEIVDTGPGIARDLQGLVFEPYVRGPAAAAAGIGLGLATVKRIIETHGGTLGLDSSPGRGSSFWFELRRPMAEARLALQPRPAPASAA